jgi:hypothetical protein
MSTNQHLLYIILTALSLVVQCTFSQLVHLPTCTELSQQEEQQLKIATRILLLFAVLSIGYVLHMAQQEAVKG